MSEHAYKMIELVGSSHTSIEGAVQNAVAKVAIDEKSLRWFEVLETRGGMSKTASLPTGVNAGRKVQRDVATPSWAGFSAGIRTCPALKKLP